MSFTLHTMPVISNNLSITLAEPDQVPAIREIINHAFWPSHKVFLDEGNPASKLRVSDEFIREAICADDKEFYVLFDTVNSLILGTILLQKNVEGESKTAKFNLLARNPNFSSHDEIKVGDLLMNHIIHRVEQLGKSILKIEVIDSGEESNKLLTYYEERGFKRTGRILGFPRKHCLKPDYRDKVCLIELQRIITKSKE